MHQRMLAGFETRMWILRKSRSRLSVGTKSSYMSKKTPSIVLTTLIACFVAYFITTTARAVLSFPERHARSCLVTITEIADRAVNDEIPKGFYREAIIAAEYIDSYYPVGTVLPEGHRFAVQYREERREQIERGTEALKDATGMNFGKRWSEWKDAFDEANGGDK